MHLLLCQQCIHLKKSAEADLLCANLRKITTNKNKEMCQISCCVFLFWFPSVHQCLTCLSAKIKGVSSLTYNQNSAYSVCVSTFIFLSPLLASPSCNAASCHWEEQCLFLSPRKTHSLISRLNRVATQLSTIWLLVMHAGSVHCCTLR